MADQPCIACTVNEPESLGNIAFPPPYTPPEPPAALMMSTGELSSDTSWATVDGTLTRSTHSESGVIEAGANFASVVNAGSEPGVLLGAPFAVGASITFQAYADPATQTFHRLPEIDFDATGTVFHIARQG